MLMVAVLNQPLVSEGLTVKRFVPTSEKPGVPERVPLAATLSQAGPLTLAKVSASPVG
jgi:hypothetical protein